MSFFVSIPIIIVGIIFSSYTWIPEGSPTLPIPILFQLIGLVFQPLGVFPPIPTEPGVTYLRGVALHPLAFAGWVGIFVTLVNLIPAGMLDGGHVTRSFLGERTRNALVYLTVAMLFVMGPTFYFMAFIALFFSMQRHPGPFDDVSKITTNRKVVALALVLIFILSIDWFKIIQTLTSVFTWV
jgi:membrane-associated protease RseP (regulator of RpoE activity)